jgi:C-terminal processing protease CtpA/Prc
MRVLLLGCLVLLGTACRDEHEARFDYTHVRTVITTIQQHLVDPISEAELVMPACDAVLAFVEGHGDSVEIRCEAVDTMDELETVFQSAITKGRVDQSELLIATNVAIARTTGHSHTVFIPFPDAELQERTLGFHKVNQGDSWLVWEVPTGTGAHLAGLRPGDVIGSVNGVAVKEWDGVQSLDEVVNLQLVRPNVGPLEIEVRWTEESHGAIETDLLPGSIAYARIRAFVPMQKQEEDGPSFGVTLSKAIHDLNANRPRGWILDLRSNFGGAQDTCAFITGLFAKSGYPIERPFISEGRSRAIAQTVWPQPLEDPRPVVILVDEGSTSCSEIVAESLRQSVGAVIVGTRTPGAVELAIPISVGDGTLLVTVARVKIGPAALDIERIGVMPDHTVELDALELSRGHDAQLEFAVSLLQPVP